jgi:hypothetical protein
MIEHTCDADRGVDGAGRMVDEDRQVPAKGFGDTKARRDVVVAGSCVAVGTRRKMKGP